MSRSYSPWSEEYVLNDNEEPIAGYGTIVVVVVVSIVVVIAVILLAICLRHKCNRRPYNNVPNYDYGRKPATLQRPVPNVDQFLANHNSMAMNSYPSDARRSMPAPTTSPPPPPSSNAIHTLPHQPKVPGVKDYSHLLLPVKSIQTTPLPPVPGKEPVYEEVRQDTKLIRRPSATSRTSRGSLTLSFEGNKKSGANSDEEFLEPVRSKPSRPSGGEESEEDNDYLKPRKYDRVQIRGNEDDEYLKPTFNQFERIDPHDLSPPHEQPPAIPIQSYIPLKRNQDNVNQTNP